MSDISVTSKSSLRIFATLPFIFRMSVLSMCMSDLYFLAPAVTVGETEGAMDSTSVFFWPLLLPILCKKIS